MKMDSVDFHVIDFWIQLWGLPFECITQEIGTVIGKQISEVLEVNKVLDVGEWGRYIRVKIKIPLNLPLRRSGNVVLGEGEKCWVDYKYDRLLLFYHYCGMLDHETKDCAMRGKDVLEGCMKANLYGPWMVVVPSSRTGYKWRDTIKDSQPR